MRFEKDTFSMSFRPGAYYLEQVRQGWVASQASLMSSQSYFPPSVLEF